MTGGCCANIARRRSRRNFRFENGCGCIKMQNTILRRTVSRLERHSDACAAGGAFRYRDRSIMPPDNLLDEMETQSCAAAMALRPIERFEYAFAIASLYAGTVIGHRYRGGRLHPHRDAPFAAAMLDRILNQIGQRPLQ